MNSKTPLCIKLDKDTRDKFKELTHSRRTTMQGVLTGFVAYYLSNPDIFEIKNDTILLIQEGVTNGAV